MKKKGKKVNKKAPVAAKNAAGEKTEKRRSEFRYPKKRPNDTTTLHPMYIYKKRGKNLVGLEITHDRKGANHSKTVKLEKNPNPRDSVNARIKKKAQEKSEKDFGERLKGWSFQTEKDKKTVNEIIKQNNQKDNEKRKGG